MYDSICMIVKLHMTSLVQLKKDVELAIESIPSIFLAGECLISLFPEEYMAMLLKQHSEIYSSNNSCNNVLKDIPQKINKGFIM